MNSNVSCFVRLLFLIGLILLASCSRDPVDEMKAESVEPAKPAVNSKIEVPKGQPFVAKPIVLGKTAGKFVEVDSDESGVSFSNRWPVDFHPELPNSFITAGIAIGDFDSDGLPDFFACRRIDGGCLYRNTGNFQFEDVTSQFGIDLTGHWGTGATFADINNDGQLDLCVCGLDCPNKVFINRGDRFEDQASDLGLSYVGPSVVLTFSDFDRDGDLDAYLLTNHTKSDPRPNINVPKDKDGRPMVPPEYGESFYYVAHPDGHYIKEWAGRYDHLYRNDGDKFVDVSKEAGISRRPFFGLSATWWDYNDDGWPDLFVSNDFKGPDHLFRNNGPNKKGVVTFTDVARHAFPHTPWFSMGSDIADINNDGLMDLLATDMGGTNHYRDKLSMGPMSGPDSRAWFLNVPRPPQYMRNCVFINSGKERFLEAAFLTSMAATDWTWTVRFSDFDQDGMQDAYFTNGMSRDWFNGDTRARAKQYHDQAGGGERGQRQGFEYWNLTPRYMTENLAFRNKGDLEFENVSTEWGLDHKGVSTGGATGDLDGDGDLDIIINGFDEPLKIYRNEVADGNVLKVYLQGRWSNRFGFGSKVTVETADADGNSQKQIRYVNSNQGIMSSGEPVAHFGLGAADKINEVTIDWSSGVVQTLDTVEVNSSIRVFEPDEESKPFENKRWDKNTEMFRRTADFFPRGVRHEELPFDDFLYQPLLPNKYTQLGPGISWSDIDGDGDHDCFVGAARGTPSRIYLNDNGKLTASRQTVFDKDRNAEDMGSLFFDSDGDGDLDLYVVSGSGESRSPPENFQDRLYQNDGEGNFVNETESRLPEISASGSCVCGCDFDRDGDIDLFVGGRIVPGEYPAAPRSHLLVNDNGKFSDKTDSIAPGVAQAGMVTSAIWSDVNNDDSMDLLIAYEWGPVRLFLNESGSFVDVTESAGLDQFIGWYNSISSGDVDNDGDPDFVVGNFGLNTKYYASPEKPELLFYGEFDDTGNKHIIEAKFENDVCLPRRGLGCSSHAMPIIKEKLPTFHDFASSALEDIYSSQSIDNATRFEINNLKSIVLVNESKDQTVAFEIKPLPALAQISPIFGSVLLDFDGDNTLDLVVAQNFFGPQRETGKMDGGLSLLLKGNGDGRFETVWPNQSGIAVTGDATSLTVVDANNDVKPDLVFGRNDSMPVVLLNQVDSDYRVLKLRGPKHNLNCVGTRAVVHSGDQQQCFEINCGGNYLSQSPAQIYFSEHNKIDKIEIKWSDGKITSIQNPKFEGGVCVADYAHSSE